MDIDEVYVQLTLLRDDRKLAGTTQEELQDYSELFASHGHHLIPKRILVYGRPGIGKSTLTKKLAVDWSRGNKEILKKFAVVLLIKLRDVCNTQDFCAMLQKAELLSAGDPMVFSQLYDYILRNQQKVLLILDGYDECSAEKSSPFHLIWKGTQLRDCTLLVTTRSLKKDELRPGSHAQFEINGFDQCQVKTFALKFLRDEAKVDKFLRFLREHSLGALAEIPLLLLMLVLSWNVNDYQGPSASRALLYSSFCQTLLDHVTTKTSDRTFRSIDEYKEDLAKLGELAWQALLNDCLYFKLSNVPEDIRLFLEKFIDFGFLQTSNLSNSPRPEKLAFFLHKSVQEFLSALFIVRDLKNAKETFNCLSKLDFLKQFDEVLEVFKFVSELSSEATVAIFRHLKMTGEKEGLTDYNFGENPSIEELTREQREFYRISLDLFLSCPTSERENVYPSFLQCVNGLVVIEDKQLPKVSSEHCLRSTNFHDKPDYVFFTSDSPRESKVLVDQMFSVMSDLDTVVVTFYGDVKSINTCRYNDLKRKEFVIKKVGHRLVFCLTRLEFISRTSPKFIELLTSLISAPKPSLQEPDHVSHNHDVCNSLQLTKKTSEQTLTHSLSYVRKSKIWGPTSELVSLLNTLHHVPRLSKLDVLHVGMENQDCPLLATALTYVDKLRLLRLSDNPLGRGISVLAKHLYSVPHLKKLDLIATQMGEEEVTALAHSLKYVTQLSELDLSNNPLGHGIIELAKHLYSVPHLIKLYLRATQMVEEEVTALAHSLKYVTQLSELDLSKNPLGHGIIELAKHLYSVPDLIKLYLRATQMGEEEVTALARSLRYVTQLSELDLSNNPLGHGIIELAKHLYSVRHLKKLDLRATQMGEEEVTALACSLKYVTQLSELDLLNNPLGHRISELAKQLHNVPHLEKLCLQNTQMDEEEVKALAHSLKNVTQLSELHLSNNPLGHGISEFAKHLHNVPHLKKLYLDDTQMGVGEVTALAHILINVPELELLSLGKNPLGRGVTELIKCLRSSPQLSDLGLKNVQLTKKEAIELCTLANERNFLMAPWRSFPHFTSFVTNKCNMNLNSDYHVSFSFVIPIINARNTQEPPGRRKGTVLQRSCVAILIHTKKTQFCKRKLVEWWSGRDTCLHNVPSRRTITRVRFVKVMTFSITLRLVGN